MVEDEMGKAVDEIIKVVIEEAEGSRKAGRC